MSLEGDFEEVKTGADGQAVPPPGHEGSPDRAPRLPPLEEPSPGDERIRETSKLAKVQKHDVSHLRGELRGMRIVKARTREYAEKKLKAGKKVYKPHQTPNGKSLNRLVRVDAAGKPDGTPSTPSKVVGSGSRVYNRLWGDLNGDGTDVRSLADIFQAMKLHNTADKPDTGKIYGSMLQNVFKRGSTIVLFRSCRLDEKPAGPHRLLTDKELAAAKDEHDAQRLLNHVCAGSRRKYEGEARTFMSASYDPLTVLWWSLFGMFPVLRIEVELPAGFEAAKNNTTLRLWDMQDADELFEAFNRKTGASFAKASAEVVLLQQEEPITAWKVNNRVARVHRTVIGRVVSPSKDGSAQAGRDHVSMFPLDLKDLKVEKKLEPSTSDALLVSLDDGAGGKVFFVMKRAASTNDAKKVSGTSNARTALEFFSACMYLLAGVNAPACALYRVHVQLDGVAEDVVAFVLLSEFIGPASGKPRTLQSLDAISGVVQGEAEQRAEAHRMGQALDALLAHADVAGPKFSNVVLGKNDEVYRVDFDRTVLFLRSPGAEQFKLGSEEQLSAYCSSTQPMNRNSWTDANDCRKALYAGAGNAPKRIRGVLRKKAAPLLDKMNRWLLERVGAGEHVPDIMFDALLSCRLRLRMLLSKS